MPSLFHYQVLQDPDSVKVTAEITKISYASDASEPSVEMTVTEIEPFITVLHSDDAGITQKIAAAVEDFTNVFCYVPYDSLKSTVIGHPYTFAFREAIGCTLTVNGDTITVRAKPLAIESHQGMLMAHGTVEIR
ncbi:hypothetical protein [Kitasatospora griseola]|uniref:hypothetical protein n=1 Tax=Kitasatospora griseola TaxID=2064 RepID=UPI003824E135